MSEESDDKVSSEDMPSAETDPTGISLFAIVTHLLRVRTGYSCFLSYGVDPRSETHKI